MSTDRSFCGVKPSPVGSVVISADNYPHPGYVKCDGRRVYEDSAPKLTQVLGIAGIEETTQKVVVPRRTTSGQVVKYGTAAQAAANPQLYVAFDNSLGHFEGQPVLDEEDVVIKRRPYAVTPSIFVPNGVGGITSDAVGCGDAVVYDKENNAVAGGSSVSGWQQRVLNTVSYVGSFYEPDGSRSDFEVFVDNNFFLIPAINALTRPDDYYVVEWSCPCFYSGNSRSVLGVYGSGVYPSGAILYTYPQVSDTCWTGLDNAPPGPDYITQAWVSGRAIIKPTLMTSLASLELFGGRVCWRLSLQHWCSTARGGDGLGTASSSGRDEIYSHVNIRYIGRANVVQDVGSNLPTYIRAE